LKSDYLGLNEQLWAATTLSPKYREWQRLRHQPALALLARYISYEAEYYDAGCPHWAPRYIAPSWPDFEAAYETSLPQLCPDVAALVEPRVDSRKRKRKNADLLPLRLLAWDPMEDETKMEVEGESAVLSEADSDSDDESAPADLRPTVRRRISVPSTAGPSTARPSSAGPSTAGPSTAGPSTAGSSSNGGFTFSFSFADAKRDNGEVGSVAQAPRKGPGAAAKVFGRYNLDKDEEYLRCYQDDPAAAVHLVDYMAKRFAKALNQQLDLAMIWAQKRHDDLVVTLSSSRGE
jgi:hypothetical protein